jgi:hypothetical protein
MNITFEEESRYLNRIVRDLVKQRLVKNEVEIRYCLGELEAVVMHSQSEEIRHRAQIAMTVSAPAQRSA